MPGCFDRPVRDGVEQGARPLGGRRASENDDQLEPQLHAKAFLHAVLNAAGQVQDVLAGGLTVVDQHQGMVGRYPGIALTVALPAAGVDI